MVCKLYLNQAVKNYFKKELEENVKQCECVCVCRFQVHTQQEPRKRVLNEGMGRWRGRLADRLAVTSLREGPQPSSPGIYALVLPPQPLTKGDSTTDRILGKGQCVVCKAGF